MYLKVYLKNPPPNDEEVFIEDNRPLPTLAGSLVTNGYLVSERVTIRWAFSAVEYDGTEHRVDYFSAKPAGKIVLLASSIDYLAERVVPPNAQPMPD